MSLDVFADRTLAAIGADSVRDDARPVPLDETAWSLARLSDDALARLSTFLLDLSLRAPLAGPAWTPITMVIQALQEDIRRELAEVQRRLGVDIELAVEDMELEV